MARLRVASNSPCAAGRSYYTFDVSARIRGLCPHVKYPRLCRGIFIYKSSNQEFSFSVSFNAVRKLLIQGAVNSMGTACISTFTADICIEGFANSFDDSGGDTVTILWHKIPESCNRNEPKKAFSALLL